MKSTGIVRKIDELGRVVLPIELRRTLEIGEKDPVEVFVDGDKIILRKYKAGCTLCDNVDGVYTEHHGKLICHKCVDEMAAKRVSKHV